MRVGRFLAGLVLSFAGGWLASAQTFGGSAAGQAGVDVPVEFEGVQNTRVDDSAVSTTLHEYIRGTDTVTGRSITFSFPANYYAWAENARGGPQYRIGL